MLARASNTSAASKVRQTSKTKKSGRGNQETSPTHARILQLKILTSLFIPIALVLGPSPAHAHTSLLQSNPIHNSKLDYLPNEVELSFTDQLINLTLENPNTLSIRDPKKNLVPLGEINASSNMLIVPIADGSYVPGIYKVYYRVISNDGHPVSGYISFETTASTEIKNGIIAVKQISDATRNPIELLIDQIHHHFQHIVYGAIALILIALWAIYRRKK